MVTELLLELQQHSGAMLITVTHSDSLAAAMGREPNLIDGHGIPRDTTGFFFRRLLPHDC
jgi:ABC-type lipoprotein export system ATPase subunit